MIVRDNGGEIVKKYPGRASNREIILLIAGRIPGVSAVPRAVAGWRKKEGGFPPERGGGGKHIRGTEPNGKWRLNYRLRRILRVCTAAWYKRCSCRVCLSTEIDSRTTDGGRDERRDRRTKSERGEKGGRGRGRGGDSCEDGRRCVARAALKRHNSNSPGSSKINQLGRSVSGY